MIKVTVEILERENAEWASAVWTRYYINTHKPSPLALYQIFKVVLRDLFGIKK